MEAIFVLCLSGRRSYGLQRREKTLILIDITYTIQEFRHSSSTLPIPVILNNEADIGVELMEVTLFIELV